MALLFCSILLSPDKIRVNIMLRIYFWPEYESAQTEYGFVCAENTFTIYTLYIIMGTYGKLSSMYYGQCVSHGNDDDCITPGCMLYVLVIVFFFY